MAKENKEKVQGKLGAGVDNLFAKVGKLTRVQRLLICLASLLAIGGAYYYFIYAPKAQTLKTVRTDLQNQENMLRTYQMKARRLPEFEKQMAQVQEEFDTAMKALPDKKELPSLLVGISKAGGNAGLQFLLFQPEPVKNKDFYKEIPLSLSVKGSYHQIADFFFQVANLNRIVNIDNLSMARDNKEKGQIQMKCSAVTYMFSEQGPEDSKGQKGNKKKKRG